MLMTANDTALVVIDLQQKLLPVIHENERVLAQAVRMATIAGLLGVPVIGTEQLPDKLGPNHPDVRRLCDKTVAKHHFDACAGGLLPALPAPVRQVVICGCEAHICLLQTALSLLEKDFQVYVLTDACGSRNIRDRDAGFARLQQAGAVPVTVEMVAYEWMRTATHPQFKSVLKLIK